jgi:anti-sigma factor RsiW
MNEQIEQWIPWYVNGTLGAKDRAEMDRYLATNAEAHAEIALLRKTTDAMRSSVAHVPADRGLHAVMARIHAEKMSSRKAQKPMGFIESIRTWLGGSWTQPALALALVVIGVQSTLLLRDAPQNLQMRGANGVIASSTAAAGPVAYLRVSFKPSATEGEMRVLLAVSNTNVTAGPGENGEYTLSVAEKDAVRALEIFTASQIVENAASTLAPR